MLEKAIELALKHHKGQKKSRHKDPYIMHVLRVIVKMNTEEEMIVAALHDVIEKSGITLSDLRKFGFSKKVVSAVDCLTRRNGESVDANIKRIKKNKLAVKVKIADLEDNMDLRRKMEIKDIDIEKLLRRKKFWEELVNH